MFYLACVILNSIGVTKSGSCLIIDCCIWWMLLFHWCFDSGVFWPELSAAPTVCISQIFILFRNTWLHCIEMGIGWDDLMGTPEGLLGCQSFAILVVFSQTSDIRKGRLGDHEMPWFKAHWGDMKVCRRWRGLDGNYWSSRHISKGD